MDSVFPIVSPAPLCCGLVVTPFPWFRSYHNWSISLMSVAASILLFVFLLFVLFSLQCSYIEVSWLAWLLFNNSYCCWTNYSSLFSSSVGHLFRQYLLINQKGSPIPTNSANKKPGWWPRESKRLPVLCPRTNGSMLPLPFVGRMMMLSWMHRLLKGNGCPFDLGTKLVR